MKIRYFDLPAKEKQVLDLIMENGKHGERDLRRGLSKEMGVAERTAKAYLHRLYNAYNIDARQRGPWAPSVRLVYLRAKEMGLIQ
jgi:predicted transcriptional regulator